MFIPSIRLIIYYARDETLIIVIKLKPTRRQSIFHCHLCTAHMYRIYRVSQKKRPLVGKWQQFLHGKC